MLDDALHDRLVRMTTDFQQLWDDPTTPNRERERLLASIFEDAALRKVPADGATTIHVRFKGGRTETLTTVNPKSSAQQIRTPPPIIGLVDRLLDDHIYAEVADQLNASGWQPGGSARRGRGHAGSARGLDFTALRVAYVVNHYALRSRYDRLRDRGLLTKAEAAHRLGIHESTLVRWAESGLVIRHAYNAHAYLYEVPDQSLPTKHCSRWDRIADRVAALKQRTPQDPRLQSKEV